MESSKELSGDTINIENLIPSELLSGYKMNGEVSIHDYVFTTCANRTYLTYSKKLVNNFITLANNKSTMHYPETDQWLYQAIEKYSINNDNLLIIGSEEPCYEGIALANGANVTMVEYQKIISRYPSLKTMTVLKFEKSKKIFDSAISISSVEHSGLGRYGDELDPDGDLKSMKLLRDKLKIGGLCFLAVPMGKDQILWNAHRVYGRHRFPLLIDGWEIVETFGLIDSDYDVDENLKRLNGKQPHRIGVSGGAHQPIIVLRKK